MKIVTKDIYLTQSTMIGILNAIIYLNTRDLPVTNQTDKSPRTLHKK